MKKLLLLLAILQIAILSQAQTYQIGDIVYSPDNEPAVVFYVFEDGNHGWAVAIRDLPNSSVFSNFGYPAYEEFPNADKVIPYFIKKAVINDTSVSGYQPYLENIDGWLTNKMHIDSALYFVENYDISMLPPRASMPQGDAALNWFFPYMRQIPFSSGWYLPTAGQMRKLFAAEMYIERILHQHNSRWLKPRRNYWTCTATNDTMAVAMIGSSGQLTPVLYRAASQMRPIRNFGYVWKEEKDKYVCCGDKVAELGYEFIAENDTSISRTFTSYKGFDSIITLNIRVLCPNFNIAGDQLVCNGQDANLTINHDEGTFRYHWREAIPPYSTFCETQTCTIENIAQPKNYVVDVDQFFEQTNKYCTKRQEFDIAPLDIDFSIHGRNIICYNSDLRLEVANTAAGTQYTWFENSLTGNTLGNDNTLNIENLTNGNTYFVSVAGGECTGTASITVDVAPPFTANITDVAPICYGENINLQAQTNSTGRISYAWLDDQNRTISNSTNLLTNNLYNSTQFTFNAFKTNGVNPTTDNIAVGDIITANNIVVKPDSWEEAEMQNLVPMAIIYDKNEDTIRVASVHEFAATRWGGGYSANEYVASYLDAKQKKNGKQYTEQFINALPANADTNNVAALKVKTLGDRWYLPALGELDMLINASTNDYFQQALTAAQSPTINENDKFYWSITEENSAKAWSAAFNSYQSVSKYDELFVRPVATFTYDELILFKNSTSCLATASILVDVEAQKTRNVHDTITFGQTYTYRDSTASFYDIGDYNFTWIFHNSTDCDSIIYLDIFVKPVTVIVTPNANQNKTCGELDPIFDYQLSTEIEGLTGQLQRTQGDTVGTYSYTLGTLNAGDLYLLELNQEAAIFEILPIYLPQETANACGSFVWNGQTYTQTGNYEFISTNNAGCKVVQSLNLTILPAVDTNHIYHTACNYYVWDAGEYGTQNYSETGNYSFNYYTASGCDSVVTLHLTINQTVQNDIEVEACSYYEYNGRMYFTSGNYPVTFTAASGCDSIVNLHLTISYIPDQPVCTTTATTRCDEYPNGQINIIEPLGEQYLYSIDGENFQTQPIFNNLAAGSYDVSVKSGSCMNYTNVEVNATIPETPFAVITNNTNCNGEANGQIVVTQPLGSQYAYSIDGINFQAETNFAGLDEGDYSITVSRTGCLASSDVLHVTTILPPQPMASSTANTNCSGSGNGQIIINEPLGDEYTYSVNGINFQASPLFESLNEGDYTIVVSRGGCTSEANVNVGTTVERPQIDLSQTRVNVCRGETILLDASGTANSNNIAYLWTGPNEFYSEIYSPEIENADFLHQGWYKLLVNDIATGCNITDSVLINVSDYPDVTIYDEINGDEITLTAEGAETYLWENGSTNESITLTLVNDTIWVIGYNEYQCSDTASIIITRPTVSAVEDVPQISIYPVPATDIVYIQGSDIEQIAVFDLNGRRLLEQRDCSFVNALDMSHFAAGEYFVEIKTSVGMRKGKIVIAR